MFINRWFFTKGDNPICEVLNKGDNSLIFYDFFLQFNVSAYDGGSPRQRTQGQVTLNLNRNLFPPEITNTDVEFNINEDAQTFNELFRVQSRDNDTTEVSDFFN